MPTTMSEETEKSVSGFDVEIVKDLIVKQWSPDQGGEPIAHQEILEFVTQVEPICSHNLFMILLSLGFHYSRIDNQLYWKAKEV
jgi:hypothetical protein